MINIESKQELNGNISASGKILASIITQTGPKGDPGKDGTGISILGVYDTLEKLKEAHPTGNVGDAYMIGTNLYVWNAISNDWIDVGNIQGPQGDVGPKGDIGPEGKAATIEIGTVTTGEAGTSATVNNSGTDNAAIFNFIIPQGVKGDVGPKGEQGEKGEQGPQGDAGSDVVVSATEPTGDNRKKVWIQKSKNLFNKDNYISNLLVDANGNFTTDSNSTLYYIEVKEGETYTLSSNVNRQWVCSTSVNIPILNGSGSPRTVTTGYTTQVTIPKGDKYLIVRHYPSISEDNITQDIQVEHGTVATTYEEPVQPVIYIYNDYGIYDEFIKKENALDFYSTEEKVVGKWIDGKPLYRKVITYEQINNNGETLLDTNIENAIVIDIRGVLINPEKNGCFDIPFHVDTLYLYVNTLSNGGQIRIRTNDSWDGFSLNLILEYIKITD